MILLLRLVVVAFGSMMTAATHAQTGTHDGFELVRDDDGIRVWERWRTFPKSDPPIVAREVKSEFYVRTTIHDALALVRDESRTQKWQRHVSEFRIYAATDSSWIEYSYHDIPWPVSDQDHLLRYTIGDPLEDDGIFVTFETVHDDQLAPERDDVSRMTLSGSWYFQEVGGDQIKVTYRIRSMPGSLPRFVTDPVIRSNLMSTVRHFIDLLESGYQKKDP